MADQPQGTNPPRPGDPVPAGGLDPTQVFSTPPPPPPAAGASQGQAQGQDDGGAPPVQDTSPPPPPVGTAATKEMGYDDEDLKILAEVGNYRFGSISIGLNNENVVIPVHPETKFDEQKFLILLRGSISLTRDEKWRIIQAVPKLSQFQIDELQKILEEEKIKFSQLSPKHLKHLQQLERRHSEDWKDLQALYVQQKAKQKEQSQADDIRKQLGLQ
jgi:hypothetical protein